MKKQSVNLKRLSLNKAVLAQLNNPQQDHVKGGIAVTAPLICGSKMETCASAPKPGMHCVICQ